MSVLRNLEARIEGLVEGVFSRAFSSQVQPVEIARKLAKEMDSHKTASVSQTYAPNSYTVWLSPDDHERLEGYTRSLSQELSAYLLEHARRQDYALLTRPEVKIEVDERLRLGEFGIQPRLVKPPVRKGDTGEQGQHGHTMVYSAPGEAEGAARRAPPGGPADPDEGDRLLPRPPLRARRPDRGHRPLARERLRHRRSERLAPARRAAAQQLRRLADRRPRLDQRGQGQRPPHRHLAPRARRRGLPRHVSFIFDIEQ